MALALVVVVVAAAWSPRARIFARLAVRARTYASLVADVTFTEVFDWLADRKDQLVSIEVGCKDPESSTPAADYGVIRLRTTLGAVGTAVDGLHGRRALRVLIDDDDRYGIEIDEAVMRRAAIHLGVLKVWQHETYITVMSSRDD